MSEQRVQILIRLLLRSSLIRIYTVCHSFYIFWRHYFIVKLNCFILRITTVAGLGVPIFRVFYGKIFSLSLSHTLVNQATVHHNSPWFDLDCKTGVNHTKSNISTVCKGSIRVLTVFSWFLYSPSTNSQ